MPLRTSSAGAIIYSMLLTKFAVLGCYEVHLVILRNKISTQQSTWMEMVLEDGGSVAVALKDGSIGRWLKIAVLAFAGGGGRRKCKDGVGVSIVKAKGLLL
jgi:hypothetical protein